MIARMSLLIGSALLLFPAGAATAATFIATANSFLQGGTCNSSPGGSGSTAASASHSCAGQRGSTRARAKANPGSVGVEARAAGVGLNDLLTFPAGAGAHAFFGDRVTFSLVDPSRPVAEPIFASLNYTLDPGTLNSTKDGQARLDMFVVFGGELHRLISHDGVESSSTRLTSLGGTFSTPTVGVPLNLSIPFGFSLEALAGAGPVPGFGSTSATSDFFNTLSLAQSGPVFNLPEGITANAGNYLVNNRFIDPTAAVPEPATWAMLITGFGVVGVAIRRRRRPVAALA
jgi:hypothetical protein